MPELPRPARALTLATVALVATLSPSFAQDLNDPQLRVPVEHWGCTNCHQPDESNAHRVGQRPGPDLTAVGERLSADWMKRWIAKPASIKGAPTMPRLFGEGAAEAADLDAVVHFLASTGVPAGGAVATEESVLLSGRELYHTLGCVNCHGALESPAAVFAEDLLPQDVPNPFVFSRFGDLAGKWNAGALSAFLRDPLAVHRDARMPRMGLTEVESDHLTAYLLSRWGAAQGTFTVDPALAERGRAVFQERGCQACHVVGNERFAPFAAPKLSELAPKGPTACVGFDEWDGPRYDLPAPPMASMMVRAVGLANSADVSDARLDHLERQVSRLNCRACHELDEQGGIPPTLRPYAVSNGEDADLGDEGRYPPHLNGVGAKLTTGWFQEVLLRGGQARPYLATRMPQYGEVVADFAELFAHKEGLEPHSDTEWPTVTDDDVLVGREMMSMSAFACVNCHSFGDLPPVGTPGPDMTRFAERLRYAWWDSYIQDPPAFKPGTRMPKFTDDDGKSVYTKFCGGDFQKQTDAMWAYFTLGEFMPAPEGVGVQQGLVLQVGDKPRVFRTYLDSAGSRGIAVGFPVGIHYAYDAGGARLMEVWQGPFIDASGAWAGRGGNSTGAQGEVLWKHAGGPAVVIGAKPRDWPEAPEEEAAPQFKGYRVGSDDGPTFSYAIGNVQVRETNVPHRSPKRTIERQFTFDGLLPRAPIWFRPGGEIVNVGLQGSQNHGPIEGANGETWYRVIPDEGSCRVVLEVAL